MASRAVLCKHGKLQSSEHRSHVVCTRRVVRTEGRKETRESPMQMLCNQVVFVVSWNMCSCCGHMQDTIILSAVIAVCTLFTLIYWWNKR